MNAEQAARTYEEVARLYVDEGMSAQAIAQQEGLSERQIIKFLRAQHLYDPGRQERSKQARAQAAAALAAEGKTYEEIATLLDFADRSGAYRAVQSHRLREETHERNANGGGTAPPAG